jgi:hypothetical protein
MTSPELRELLLAAVADAINYLEDDRVFCPDCRNSPGAVCLEHKQAASLAAQYAEIHAQLREAGSGRSTLGGYRPVAARHFANEAASITSSQEVETILPLASPPVTHRRSSSGRSS